MRRGLATLCSFAIAIVCFGSTYVLAQANPDPWREPQDTVAALFESDRYAWQLFVALSWPADASTKAADPTRLLGGPGPVVWETWRNIRPGAPDTVFRRDGKDPGAWLAGGGPVPVRQQSEFDAVPVKQQLFQLLRQRTGPSGPVLVFDPAVGEGNEVRMNATAYDFVRRNQLYNVQGQIVQVNSGQSILNFPRNAKEVKAQWRRIAETDKARYHWSEVETTPGTREVWGLTALHISTKDLPNWFWATFEHIDNKKGGWLVRSVDRFTCPVAPHDCENAPIGIGLEGTKWSNYRLRGTQVDFVNTMGTPTILANSQIESPFQRQSSCITCHALAAVDKDGNGTGFATVIGAPRPDWFQDGVTGQRIFMQLDFVWSLRRASPLVQP